MFRAAPIMIIGFVGFTLSACTTKVSWYEIEESITWGSEERLGLSGSDFLARQFLDSENKLGESFYLYYFTTVSPPKSQSSIKEDEFRDKTILFVAGGPGQNARLEQTEPKFFDDLTGYKVVYFHLRGSGFSQIPEPNIYDRYIRTHYAARDLEFIREKVLGSDGKKQPHRWAAVVGYSYGTVLAQQYAHMYPNSLEKLILAGPMSRHPLQSASDINAKKSMLAQMREKDRESLTKIYSSEVFRDFFATLGGESASQSLIDAVIKEFDRLFLLVEENFGSLALLNDSYNKIKDDPNSSRSAYKDLFEYSPSLFTQMREIRMSGWLPQSVNTFTNEQSNAALTIADQTLRRIGVAMDAQIGRRIDQLLTENVLEFSRDRNATSFRAQLASDYCSVIKEVRPSRETKTLPPERDLRRKLGLFRLLSGLCFVRNADASPRGGGSKRAYYVINHYDGLDLHTFGTLQSAVTPIMSPLAMAQEPHWMRQMLSKIGVWPFDVPQPWNPERHLHDVPTLILSGTADPVSAGGAADYFFDKALSNSEKLLVDIPGLGHRIDIPDFPPSDDLRDRLKHVNSCVEGATARTRACLMEAFITGVDSSTWNLLLETIGVTMQRNIMAVVGKQEHDCKIRIRDKTGETLRPAGTSCNF